MRLLFAVFTLLIHLNAHADTDEYLCFGMSGMERSECLEKMKNYAEGTLNSAYNKAISQIQDNTDIPQKDRDAWKRELNNARDKWEAYRHEHCALKTYEYWMAGSGSSVGNAIVACEVKMTIDQIDLIQGMR